MDSITNSTMDCVTESTPMPISRSVLAFSKDFFNTSCLSLGVLTLLGLIVLLPCVVIPRPSVRQTRFTRGNCISHSAAMVLPGIPFLYFIVWLISLINSNFNPEDVSAPQFYPLFTGNDIPRNDWSLLDIAFLLATILYLWYGDDYTRIRHCISTLGCAGVKIILLVSSARPGYSLLDFLRLCATILSEIWNSDANINYSLVAPTEFSKQWTAAYAKATLLALLLLFAMVAHDGFEDDKITRKITGSRARGHGPGVAMDSMDGLIDNEKPSALNVEYYKDLQDVDLEKGVARSNPGCETLPNADNDAKPEEALPPDLAM